MNPNLLLKLIEKNVIRRGTIFQAYHMSNTISCRENAKLLGNFYISAIKQNPDKSIFIEAVIENGDRVKKFYPEDIISVDGMNLMRLIKIYDLNVNGESLPPAKRRGRKPKSAMVEIEEENEKL